MPFDKCGASVSEPQLPNACMVMRLVKSVYMWSQNWL